MEKYKIAFYSGLIILLSCKPAAKTTSSCMEVTVVNKTGLDGCGYLLETANNSFLEPDNLQQKYHKDGLKLCITFKKTNKFSICMAGEMITLTSVKELK